MHLYTAEVSTAFLDKLAQPSETPSAAAPTSLDMVWDAVRLAPAPTLRDRVFALMFPEGEKEQRLGDEEGGGDAAGRDGGRRGDGEVGGKCWIGWLLAFWCFVVADVLRVLVDG